MSRLRANLESQLGAPAGSYVLPNTRAVTDNLVLEVAAGDFYNLTDPLTVADAETTYSNVSFAADLLIKIEDEVLRVTAVSSPDVDFERGYLGTTIAKHAAAADIEVEDWVDSTDNTANSDFDNTTDPLELPDAVTDYPNVDWTVGNVLLIESEKLLIGLVDADTQAVTLVRGYLGTTAAAHADAVDIEQLDWVDSTDDTGGAGIGTVDADEYAVASYAGYLVKRTQDDDEADVDWESILPYPFYWSGTIVTSNGRYTVTREPLAWFQEDNPQSPIGADGRINLELAFQAIVDTLIAAGGAFTVDERGFAFGNPPPTYTPPIEEGGEGTYSGTGVIGNEAGIAGVNAGALQAFFDALTGRILAGSLTLALTENGIQIVEGSSPSQKVNWVDELGGTILNSIGAGLEGSARLIRVEVNEATNAADAEFRVLLHDGDDEPGELRLIKHQGEGAYAGVTGSDFLGLSVGSVLAPELSDGNGVDVHGKLLRLRTSKTPASASDTGKAGEICWDSSYIYVCTATDTWKRATLNSW